ncbi:Secreted cell wall peptidase and hydrolase activator [Pontimonas salivibrio]|uniref:Secreted cell wall peptidase and hydrolase activator n=1 Tax=Pontimonas salivibrio TaxID=1159327 RepID=A0A2L2BN19_9MICO|nr:M23 family metallopeptidase [Pontimonas salivibrio]AVG23060.1 Secreted cell wall peptidase and hydrolase activator [Pontimonas salivibrio]
MRSLRDSVISLPIITSVVAALVLSVTIVWHEQAFAKEYPSWQDVLEARENEEKTQEKIEELQGLIEELATEYQAAEEEAARLGQIFVEAQQDLDDAIYTQEQLQAEANAAAETAEESRMQAGQFVAELARVGGGDLQATIFVNADEADGLLRRLGYASKIAEQTDGIYSKALADQNTAQSLTDQAEVASDIREELQVEAEATFEVANAAAMRAAQALDEQLEASATLEAQLAVLIEEREATEEDYQAGVIARQLSEVRGMIDPGQISGAGWARPTGGYISSHFGNRIHPIYGTTRFHAGIDLAHPCGQPVYAAREGTVSYAGWLGTGGNFIRLNHGNGVTTGYMHLQSGSMYVNFGERVQTGQLIARVGTTGGSTGCHLHFETRRDWDPVDPYYFMGDRGVRLG